MGDYGMILFDDGFFSELKDTWMVYIGGRLGCGKSLLALDIAEYFLKSGKRRLFTNLSTVWNDDLPETINYESNSQPAVIIVDEGGLYIRSMDTVAELSSFSRKLDSILIVCGKREPHNEICELVIRPRFDFSRNLMLPIWLWRFDVEAEKQSYHGFLWQFWRQGLFGIYDTVNPGQSPKIIVQAYKKYAEQLFKVYQNEYELSDVAHSGRDNMDFDSMVDARQNTRAIRDAVSVLANRKRR